MLSVVAGYLAIASVCAFQPLHSGVRRRSRRALPTRTAALPFEGFAESAALVDTVKAAAEGAPLVGLAIVTVDHCIPFIPGAATAVAAGALYGFRTGLAVVLLGQTLAAAVALLVGRTLIGSDRAGDLLGEKINAAVQSAFDGTESSFQKVLVMRLSPVVPFSFSNYALGAVTDAPLLPLVAGTFVGLLPLDALYVATGSLLSMGDEIGPLLDSWGLNLGELEAGLGAVGAVATVAVVYGAYLALRDPPHEEDGGGPGEPARR